MVLKNQPQNINEMILTNFRLVFNRLPHIMFFCTKAMIPGISIGTPEQPTRGFKDIALPGEKLVYEDFAVTFNIDENMQNWLEVHNWMRGLGFPWSHEEYRKLAEGGIRPTFGELYSDATLVILTTEKNPIIRITFRDLWPYQLGSINFDSADSESSSMSIDATFKYLIYDVEPLPFIQSSTS